MKLHQGLLYWPTTLEDVPTYPSLDSDIDCDVLVIGGGMSGALCTYTLAAKNVRTVLIDKGKIGNGSSSANTGLIQYSNDKMLHEFMQQMGEEDAVRFYKLCYNAVNELGNIAQSLERDVDFRSRKSLYYASESADQKKLEKEYNALNKHGFSPVYLNRTQIKTDYGFEKTGAIITSGDAEVNPQKFVVELVRAAHTKNAKVFENTIITEAGKVGEYYLFRSENATIRAKKILYTTGYETMPFAKKLGATIARSFVITTSPLPKELFWKEKCLIWETKRPYLYMRSTIDGRIVAGGLDEPKTAVQNDPSYIHKKGHLLLKQIKTLFPFYDTKIDYYYGAIFGESHDGLPYIGARPDNPDLFYSLGYGGNGAVYNMIGANIITELIINGSHEDAYLVQLNRKKQGI